LDRIWRDLGKAYSREGCWMKYQIIKLFLAIGFLSSYCHASTCRLATNISVQNLEYRMLAPTPDPERIQRAFEQLAVIDARCSSIKTHLEVGDCATLSTVSAKQPQLPARGLVAFQRVTSCILSASLKTTARQAGTRMLIRQTLREQQNSDGEASHWIANDLLALFVVYPTQMLNELENSPLFRKRFLADLGGNALEDLDDRPGAKHSAVAEKTKVLSALLFELRKGAIPKSDRAHLLDQIVTACACEQSSAFNH
jgi:hypothetical protein